MKQYSGAGASDDLLTPRPMEQWVEHILADLTMEDLPEAYQAVARTVGIENAVRLSADLGGLNYYFPQLDKMLREKRNALIRREFSGTNHKELARRYRLSEVQIREIVARPKHQQPGLFEGI